MSDVLETPASVTARSLRRSGRSPMPLRVEGLTLTLEGTLVLNDIDLALADDGVTAILGPNGAGKSLLLRCLHGLVTPTRGTILWHHEGRDHAPDLAIRKAQALVAQKPVLLRRSVLANLKFVAGLRRPRPSTDDLMQALREVRLEHLARQNARTLSGGEQQRLALARALLHDPRVLLLDEPSANLDPASTLLIETAIRAARAAGTKVLLITHDMAQARRLADDVVFLHKGRIVEHTSAAAFFDRPSSAEAEAYVKGDILL
ncbi:ABC transporter ATP-binding protein [Roseibium aestuarii]|uniref:ATP-binding cassette domain-containing protein n=1 Tax=Roseibium aestuarii TaxID=2600299 RepID=A0ABW4JS38_9HYPH|nr:ATP-binding cassette domain-containing protein [Roseibium aestuarii]